MVLRIRNIRYSQLWNQWMVLGVVLQVMTRGVEFILVPDLFACTCFRVKFCWHLLRLWRLTFSWWELLCRNEMIKILLYLPYRECISSPKSGEVLSHSSANILHKFPHSPIRLSDGTWWDPLSQQYLFTRRVESYLGSACRIALQPTSKVQWILFGLVENSARAVGSKSI